MKTLSISGAAGGSSRPTVWRPLSGGEPPLGTEDSPPLWHTPTWCTVPHKFYYYYSRTEMLQYFFIFLHKVLSAEIFNFYFKPGDVKYFLVLRGIFFFFVNVGFFRVTCSNVGSMPRTANTCQKCIARSVRNFLWTSFGECHLKQSHAVVFIKIWIFLFLYRI